MKRGAEGYVLVSVLWLLLLLASLATTAHYYTRTTFAVISLPFDKIQAEAAMLAALERNMIDIQRTDVQDGYLGQQDLRIGNAFVRSRWMGEAARVDINLAHGDMLRSVVRAAGQSSSEAERIASLIIKRRESTGIQRPASGLADIAELQTLGLPKGLFKSLAPFITIYNGTSLIDPRLAPIAVLRALPDMTEARLQTVLKIRDVDSGVKDLRPILEDMPQIARYLSLDRGHSIRMRIVTSLNNGYQTIDELVVVIYADDTEPYRIVSRVTLDFDDTISARP